MLRIRARQAKAELEQFAPFFNGHYTLRRIRGVSGSRFLPAEDHLFATGLVRYGIDRFDSIRAYMLPTKSVESLKQRYASATARRSDPNPIKRARLDYGGAQLDRAGALIRS